MRIPPRSEIVELKSIEVWVTERDTGGIPPQRKLRVGNETVLLYANISQTGPPTTTTTTTLIVLGSDGFAASKNRLLFYMMQKIGPVVVRVSALCPVDFRFKSPFGLS